MMAAVTGKATPRPTPSVVWLDDLLEEPPEEASETGEIPEEYQLSVGISLALVKLAHDSATL